MIECAILPRNYGVAGSRTEARTFGIVNFFPIIKQSKFTVDETHARRPAASHRGPVSREARGSSAEAERDKSPDLLAGDDRGD